MSSPPRTWRPTVALATVAVLTLAGCSGDDQAPSESGPSLQEPSEAPTIQIEPVTESGVVVGGLPRKDRERVEAAVSRTSVRMLESAYLSGEYPRTDFSGSFRGLTPGAAAVARHQVDLLTNQRIGGRIDGVTPTLLRVKVDLLAVRKRAVAATAHVQLAYRTTGKVERRVRVQGELRLTKRGGTWKIFAYDLTKGVR